MLNNLIKYSLRSFKRQRAYIVINVLGLSIGIACSLLIALFVINEASYDKYNAKIERIYRLILNAKNGDQEVFVTNTSPVVGPTMLKEIPEIDDFLRMNGREPIVVEYNNQTFSEDRLVEVDSSFFNFFSIPILKGDPNNLLNAPWKVVLSESTANKIFGNEDPIDKTVKIGSDSMRYTVSGVMADIPENSHFEANIISSFMTNPNSNTQVWIANSFSTYLLLKPNSDYELVNEKFPSLIEKYVGPELQKFMGVSLSDYEDQGNKYGYYLQNLADIHHDISIEQEFKEASDPKYLKIFGSIAILIVLIAAINFMNLSTALASRRAKEVGIKKIGGSSRGILILQFIAESFILSFISTILSLIIIQLSLPYFNNLLETHLRLNLFANWYVIPVLILFSLVVGFLSGSYPALYLSTFSPLEVLKGSMKISVKNGWVKRVFVVFQFSVSIMLIVGSMIMYRQIKFMLNKDVGFNKEQLIVITGGGDLGNKAKSFKEAINEISGVINTSFSTAVPGRADNNNGYMIEGRTGETFFMYTNWVDYDFLETYGMTLVEGRLFNESFTSDQDACLINEVAVNSFGIIDLENTRFIQPQDPRMSKYVPIIGVVKNFNFQSLSNEIQPYVLRFKPDYYTWGYLTVKISTMNYATTISAIENKWKEFTTNNPLQYYFLDEDFEQMYIQEKQNAQLAVIFSILAILIASLGLFGLSSFTIDQRTKEIGVRKAMGSSVMNIYIALSREVIMLVAISALIAFPVIYYIAEKWLENFYYRINLGAFSFIAGLTIAIGIAILTISYRIHIAARVNPAQSLKYE